MRGRLLAAAAALLAIGLHGARLDAQTAASVCKDGTTSAAAGKGACSGHGGVDAKATAAAKTSTKKAETPAAQVTCTDGTMSKAGRGACSGHGGVKGSAVPAATAAPTVPAAVPATSPARRRFGFGTQDGNQAVVEAWRGRRSDRRNRPVQRRQVLSRRQSSRRVLQAWRRRKVLEAVRSTPSMSASTPLDERQQFQRDLESRIALPGC